MEKLVRFIIKAIVIPYACELDFPASMKAHPLFHVSLREPVATNTQPGQISPPPPIIVVEGDDEYQVDEIRYQ